MLPNRSFAFPILISTFQSPKLFFKFRKKFSKIFKKFFPTLSKINFRNFSDAWASWPRLKVTNTLGSPGTTWLEKKKTFFKLKTLFVNSAKFVLHLERLDREKVYIHAPMLSTQPRSQSQGHFGLSFFEDNFCTDFEYRSAEAWTWKLIDRFSLTFWHKKAAFCKISKFCDHHILNIYRVKK